jgi:HEAT repeat protein
MARLAFKPEARWTTMARLAFKPDASFFRKIAIGAIGTRAIAADLDRHGHHVVELERGATDTKLWKDVKRKRVRIPDLVCTRCGRRIESRAKTKAELAMSHSLVEARAWDFGMVDSDWVAFPVCESADEDSWSVGRLRAGGSYWHEREWVRWRIGGRINYFTVTAFRAVPYAKSSTKGVTEGSETTIAWAATFATRSGVISSITGRNLLIQPAAGGRRSSRKIPVGQEILVAPGDAIETHQVLGSTVAALTAAELACPGNLPEGHIAHLLASRERTQRFTGIKLARLRGESEYRSTAEELTADDEEDVYVRLEAASYLASTCGQSARALFEPYLGSPDPQNRLEAVIALAEAATHEAVSLLSGLLDGGNQPHFLRSAAAWGLGRIGGEAAISRLMRAFADVNPAIREEALEHLATLGAAATPIFLEGLRVPSPDIAAGAAEALRRQQPLTQDVIARLVDDLRSADPSPWTVWLYGHLPRDQVAEAIADLQQTAPALHYAISLLWTFMESWIARHWDLDPDGVPPKAETDHAV